MPLAGNMMTVGTRQIVMGCPNIETKLNTPNAQNSVTANDAPRSGQQWAISSVAFKFPNAQHNNFNAIANLELEFTFAITLVVNGVQVASQEFLENSRAVNEGSKEFKMHILGSLEPFAPAIVFPGQSLIVEYAVGMNTLTANIASGQGGLVVVTYDLMRSIHGAN